MGLVHNTNVVSDGLVCCWDGGNRRCGTPSAGGSWTGLGVNAPATLVNSGASDPYFADISLGAIAFDGTDDKVTVANTTDIDGAGGFTFDICLYFLGMDSSSKYTVFSLHNSGGGAGEEFAFWIMDLATHAYTVRAGKRTTTGGVGTNRRSNDPALQPSANVGKWANWTFTYSGGDSAVYSSYKIYYNGEEKDDGTMGGAGNDGSENANRWGLDRNDAGDFYGYIGRVALYNKELTPAEILQNYEATKPRFAPRITKSNLELNFDAGDPQSYSGGTTWTDTANGIEATLMTTATVGSSFNPANGGCLEFDGTDDWIKVADTGGWSMQGWAALTVETWVNVAGNRWHRILYENQNDAATFSVRVCTDLYNANSAFWLVTTTGTTSEVQSIVSLDTWFQYVCRWDGTTMNVYKNGVKVGSGTSNSGTIESSSGSKGGVAIGAGWNSVSVQSTSELFYGKMGLLRVYQGALSDAEIMDNFQKTRGRFGG